MGTRATINFEDSAGRKISYYAHRDGGPEQVAARLAKAVKAATKVQGDSKIDVLSEVNGGLALAFARANFNVELAYPDGHPDAEYDYHIIQRENGWVAVNCYKKKATSVTWKRIETVSLDIFIASHAPELTGTEDEIVRVEPPNGDVSYYTFKQIKQGEVIFDKLAQEAFDKKQGDDRVMHYLMKSQRLSRAAKGTQK